MHLIIQRGRYDCGLACVAMATGQSYDAVLGIMSPGRRQLLERQGLTHYDIFELLFLLGHSYQYVIRWDRMRLEPDHDGRFPRRAVWPPEPWAPSHLAQLPAHWVATDSNGRVFDPAQTYTSLPATLQCAIGVFPGVG